ncbi:hypothetical protein BGW36DRAFT_387339 [Talaromyces proteolyticus]|uniref:Peptidase metallopeptidase domain-containing protein n=1 Tax=Talaromyces proteolyticus TaxID=1131652 RepID=A0AAD4PX67_9EURO|nr:uncharacterized protein BGW36DRAFT_387339 [Talaromyces proteolyticus]KAH8692294.1 hypothetical protein BGW36DRAFT_387339 [Talaromyces proteolyticus]
MIISKKFKWPKDDDGTARISIGFLDGNNFQKNRVITTAGQWENACPNIEFVWEDDPKDADVRITFNSHEWYSKVGSNAKNFPKSESTTKLRWKSDLKEMDRQILHEFGHILGAEHEQFSPSFPYKWNRDALVEYWKEYYHNQNKSWGNGQLITRAREKVDRDIIFRYRVNDPNYYMSAFDGHSIMLYEIHEEWLEVNPSFGKTPEEFPENYEISRIDRATMNKIYSG